MKKFLMGNEAVALGARDGGVKVVSSYPGTPSTEITENIAKYDEVYAEWAANEKVAAEVAMGACVAGARAMCCMKHVGLNVAADVLYTAAYTGVNGGLVFAVADDPGMHSSQNEQDTRSHAMASHVPVLEPADSNEAYRFAKRAFSLSEELDMPVILRMSTRISHARTMVETTGYEPAELKEYHKNPQKYVMMPAMARGRKLSLFERLAKAEEFSDSGEVNRMEMGDSSMGIVCSGACYQYVKEALPKASVLKIGMPYPMPKKMVQEFSEKVEKLYVIEELEPVLETNIKAMGIACVGAELFKKFGEYSAAMIKKVMLGEKNETQPVENLPIRPPVLCPGCPHRASYYVLNKLNVTAFGDIGCYTLGAMAPLGSLDSTICMGASIGMAHGASLARGRDFAKKSVAVIGDSTFMHSGLTGIASASYNQGNITVLVLDNYTTGMTGHQDHPGTGVTLQGQKVNPVDIEKAAYALGAKSVQIVDPYDLKGLEGALKSALNEEGVSVVVARRICALLTKPLASMKVEQDRCVGCGACLKTGCPALNKIDKKVQIDTKLCTGCGLCKEVCPTGCIGGAQ